MYVLSPFYYKIENNISTFTNASTHYKGKGSPNDYIGIAKKDVGRTYPISQRHQRYSNYFQTLKMQVSRDLLKKTHNLTEFLMVEKKSLKKVYKLNDLMKCRMLISQRDRRTKNTKKES